MTGWPGSRSPTRRSRRSSSSGSASGPVTTTSLRRPSRPRPPHRRPRCERRRAIDPAGTGPPSQRDADRGPRIPRPRPDPDVRRGHRGPGGRRDRSGAGADRPALSRPRDGHPGRRRHARRADPGVCAVTARHVSEHAARRRRRNEMGEAVPAGPDWDGPGRPRGARRRQAYRPAHGQPGHRRCARLRAPYAGVGVEPAQPADRVRVGRRRDPRLAVAPPDRRRRRSVPSTDVRRRLDDRVRPTAAKRPTRNGPPADPCWRPCSSCSSSSP